MTATIHSPAERPLRPSRDSPVASKRAYHPFPSRKAIETSICFRSFDGSASYHPFPSRKAIETSTKQGTDTIRPSTIHSPAERPLRPQPPTNHSRGHNYHPFPSRKAIETRPLGDGALLFGAYHPFPSRKAIETGGPCRWRSRPARLPPTSQPKGY